jgi:transcriptional regulator with XRE-family HTH domain
VPDPHPPTNAELGRAIRRVRLVRRLTIEDLAQTADMHPTYLSGIERGVRNPTWKKLTGVCYALAVPVVLIARNAEGEAWLAERARAAKLELDEMVSRARGPA